MCEHLDINCRQGIVPVPKDFTPDSPSPNNFLRTSLITPYSYYGY